MYKLFIDSREQDPLEFNETYITSTEVTGLPVGDYAAKILDHRCPVIFERKSKGDLFGTLGKGYDRFKREINRVKDLGIYLCVVVEADYEDVIKGHEYSSMDGLAVSRTLMTLLNRYKVPHIYFNNRESMAKYIAEFFYSYAKEYLRKLKEDKGGI